MIDLKFDGLDDLIKEVSRLVTDNDLEKIDREILEGVSKEALNEVKSKIHRSENVKRSGRKGSRTGRHAVDNVPMTGIKKKKDSLFVVIGWAKSDNSPYYYMKFEEWGTSKKAPHPAFYPTVEIAYKKMVQIGIEKYERVLKKVLEG